MNSKYTQLVDRIKWIARDNKELRESFDAIASALGQPALPRQRRRRARVSIARSTRPVKRGKRAIRAVRLAALEKARRALAEKRRLNTVGR